MPVSNHPNPPRLTPTGTLAALGALVALAIALAAWLGADGAAPMPAVLTLPAMAIAAAAGYLLGRYRPTPPELPRPGAPDPGRIATARQLGRSLARQHAAAEAIARAEGYADAVAAMSQAARLRDQARVAGTVPARRPVAELPAGQVQQCP